MHATRHVSEQPAKTRTLRPQNIIGQRHVSYAKDRRSIQVHCT